MRTMYDAVTAANIPGDAQMVAGYIDRIVLAPWTPSDWARFPNAVKVEIVKKASTNAGHVLDVEQYDAAPGEAPGWVRMRRAAGADPTVYCNLSTWGAVRAAFRNAGVAEPHYWIARYDGDPAWGAGWAESGVVAKQFRGDVPPGWDISSVADYWPGVDPAPIKEEDMPLTPADLDAIRDVMRYKVLATGHDSANPDAATPDVWTFGGRNPMDIFEETLNQVFALRASIDGLVAAVAALSHDPGITVDAVRQIVTDAVKQSIQITGTVQIGPAAPPTAQ